MRLFRLIALTPVAACLLVGGCRDNVPSQPASSATQPAAETPINPKITEEKIEQTLAAAQNYIQSQDYAKAIAILVTLVERAPREIRAREQYGQVLMSLALQSDARRDAAAGKDYRRKAYEQYRVAAELDPNSAGLQHSAGQMAIEAGEPEAALAHFQAAGRLDPRSSQYPLFEAQVLIQVRQLDQARAALGRVLAIDPDVAIAYASLAMIELDQQRFDEALKGITKARQLDPADIGLRAQEAKIHRRAGRPKQALELLIGLGPADRAQEYVAFELAASHEALGDLIAAARDWQHVAQSNPLHPRAWFAEVNAAEALLKAGEREQAMLWLQQAQLAAPDQPEVQDLAARLRS